jgi:hypothetical protein
MACSQQAATSILRLSGKEPAQIDGPIGEELVVMRREERPRILVDGTSGYNPMAANCEDVTVKQPLAAWILNMKTHLKSDRHE